MWLQRLQTRTRMWTHLWILPRLRLWLPLWLPRFVEPPKERQGEGHNHDVAPLVDQLVEEPLVEPVVEQLVADHLVEPLVEQLAVEHLVEPLVEEPSLVDPDAALEHFEQHEVPFQEEQP